MASPKTKPVDTSTTNPAEFLAGAPVAPAAPAAPVPPSGPPAVTPGSIESVNSLPAPPAPAAADPARPGLETPALPNPPEPFELLGKWITGDPQHGETYRNMRALAVPGGCIVRVTSIRGSNFCESICFVPGAKVQDGQLVSA